ncbi:MAG: hypothetical protein J0L63_05875 [Anaerolineae bacterium]|nr:hypothetical protein [Anaerolineae bacterium]
MVARVYVVWRREDAGLALLAAGSTVLAAAMRQWQREAGGQPPTKNGRMREDGKLPQTNAATAATSAIKMADGTSGGWATWDMANLMD